VKQRVGEVRGNIPGSEIERIFLVVEDDLSAPDLKRPDREREEILNGRICGPAYQGFRLVGTAVGIHDEMNDWTIKHYGIEADFGSQNRADLDLRQKSADVDVRDFIRSFPPANGEVAYFDPTPKRDGVNASNFDVPPGDALQFSDYAAAHHGLE
jgi:hypothetical protein